MSSGSRFILLRKHNLEISAVELDAVIKHYTREASAAFSSGQGLPLVASLRPYVIDSYYDKTAKSWVHFPYSMERLERDCRYVMLDDHKLCDFLLSWDFSSGFDCLKNEWSLSAYRQEFSQHIVSKTEASKMLQAVKYLLSEDWSDRMEEVLDNAYIKVLADGYTSYSYGKYLSRSNPDSNAKVLRHAQNGIEVTVKIPSCASGSDELDVQARIDAYEESKQIEFWLKQAGYALEAYLKSDSFSYDSNSELVLVYEAT